jgi:hypothetical protein
MTTIIIIFNSSFDKKAVFLSREPRPRLVAKAHPRTQKNQMQRAELFESKPVVSFVISSIASRSCGRSAYLGLNLS